MNTRLVKEGNASSFLLLGFCGLLAMFIGSCAQGGDGSSVQGKQKEIITPSGTRTLEQMQEYDKTHPPSGEKQVMPMPGAVPEQDIKGSPYSGSRSTGQ